MRANRILLILTALLLLTTVAMAGTIPVGTYVTVRTVSTMKSGTNHSGQSWIGTLVNDLVVNGNQTVAHAGDPAGVDRPSLPPAGVRLQVEGNVREVGVVDHAVPPDAGGV